MKNLRKKILLIYTGGTIGMVHDPKSGILKPFNFAHIRKNVPELSRFDFGIDVFSFPEVIDSSNMSPSHWVQLAKIVFENYKLYNGFVILHGTDTMAYTASALSFLLENLGKPVVITGSQLPIGAIRNDAKENLITSLEIAASGKSGAADVPEVCIFFDYQLFRGNRATKFSSAKFEAFRSVNFPSLGEAGVHIRFNRSAIIKNRESKLKLHTKIGCHVAVIKLFPGMDYNIINTMVSGRETHAVILETYGSGNAPTDKLLRKILEQIIKKGIPVFNVSQCAGGSVDQGRYRTSEWLNEIGVVSGKDITTEAAITKIMFLSAKGYKGKELGKRFGIPICGEMAE